MDLRFNQFTGTIPSEFGALTNLVVLALEGNPHLSGQMPEEVCQLASNWSLDSLSLDCTAVSCEHEACRGSDEEDEEVGEEGVCICVSDDEYNDDGAGN
jgi:hypothetical protein